MMQYIKKLIKKIPVADYISKRAIHLPSGLDLSKKDIDYIVLMLNSFQNE